MCVGACVRACVRACVCVCVCIELRDVQNTRLRNIPICHPFKHPFKKHPDLSIFFFFLQTSHVSTSFTKRKKDVPLVEFMYLAFTRMSGESYLR